MTTGTKAYVNEAIRVWKEKDEWDNYSAEVLAFSCLLGLPPAECTGMYPECEWTQEQLDEYDDMVDYILGKKRKAV